MNVDPMYSFENMRQGTGENIYLVIAKKLFNPFWKETFKVVKPLTLGYLKKYPVEIIYCSIWGSHLFLKNNALCTRAGFDTIYNKILMPVDILKADQHYKFTFLTHEEVCRRVGYVNEQQLISLKHVITVATRKYGFLLQNRAWNGTNPPILIQILNLNISGCNAWTKLMKNTTSGQRNVTSREQKWEAKLGIILGPRFWNRCYLNYRNLYYNNKIKWFYYQIVRGVLKTNEIVSKFVPGLRPECTFCNTALETISHLFYNCPSTQNFYTAVQNLLQQEMPIFVSQFTARQAIFGTNGPIDSPMNIFLVNLKYYVWVTRCKKQELCARGFMSWLKIELRLLYFIYPRNQKMIFLNTLQNNLDINR